MVRSNVYVKPGQNVLQRRPSEGLEELLSKNISDLSLSIQGTPLESLVLRLYQELENAGISFRPKTYLSDEWGCPQGVPVIGIPFYLADPQLHKLEGQLTGVEPEDPREVMMFLRHEAGHAINYAYRFHARTDWTRRFGQFSRPYKEDYRPFHSVPGLSGTSPDGMPKSIPMKTSRRLLPSG